MKKLIVLFLAIFILGTVSVSAEIFVFTDETRVVHYSTYMHSIDVKNGQSYFMSINFAKNEPTSGSSNFEVSIYTGTSNYVSYNNFDPLIIFSLKTPPNFEITLNTPKNPADNPVKIFNLPEKNTFINVHGIKHEFTSKTSLDFSKAEKITVILPLNNDTELRVELPKETVKEWGYIYNMDIDKERKELFKQNTEDKDEDA